MELTLPGFRHDVCSTILPLALASPFFRTVDLAARGVELDPPRRAGRPSARRRAGGGARAIGGGHGARASAGADGRAWRAPVRAARARRRQARPGDPPAGRPRPAPPAGARPLRPAGAAVGARPARGRFRDEPARALFAGIAGPLDARLDRPLSASFGLVLATYAHAVGWPMVRGGAAAVAAALVAELEAAGGEVVTDHRVDGPRRTCPAARAVLFDLTPRQLVAIAGDRLSATRPGAEPSGSATGRASSRWTGRSTGRSRGRPDGPRRAATVHLGGTLDEIAAAEADVAAGRHPERPYVLFVQYAPWDTSRAPAGKTTAWAYCHVPAGSDVDMTDRIEAQVERFAPGFRDRILARSVHGAGRDGGPRRELRRRRHQRRHPGHPPAHLPAVAVARPVSGRRRAVPLLVVDAARRRRPRHERDARRAARRSTATKLR